MKRIILLAIILACFAYEKVSAQTINGVKLSELKEPYIEVSAFKQSFSSKMAIWLEYGQKVLNDRHAAIVKDENGKHMEFNSAIDFINKMKKYGYEIVNAYATSSSDGATKYYVLKFKE